MPNYLYLIVENERLPKKLREFKSFTARRIMQQKKDYTHCNTVKASFVDDLIHWKYSTTIKCRGRKELFL
jgi:hypothetical protein